MLSARACARLFSLAAASAVIGGADGMARAALFPFPARMPLGPPSGADGTSLPAQPSLEPLLQRPPPPAEPPPPASGADGTSAPAPSSPEPPLQPAPPRPPALSPPPPRTSAPLPVPPPSIIRRVDVPEMKIAITFDACATSGQPNGFDRPVLRALQREQVPATIFTSGRWVETHPAAMAQLIAEPLIEFANHSYDHPHMSRLSVGEIGAEIDRTEAALARYGRRSVAFRPPFGDFDDRVLEVARERQIPAVLWDVVSGDPSASATVAGMTRTVVRNTLPGSIVIFHINSRETKTAAALPVIIRQLRARGFEFVHLSDLLAAGAPTGNPEDAVANLPGPGPGDGIMPLEDAGPTPESQEPSRVDPPPLNR